MLIINSKEGYWYAGFQNGYHQFIKSDHSDVSKPGISSISEIISVKTAKLILGKTYVYICKDSGAVEPTFSTSKRHNDSNEVLTNHSRLLDLRKVTTLV